VHVTRGRARRRGGGEEVRRPPVGIFVDRRPACRSARWGPDPVGLGPPIGTDVRQHSAPGRRYGPGLRNRERVADDVVRVRRRPRCVTPPVPRVGRRIRCAATHSDRPSTLRRPTGSAGGSEEPTRAPRGARTRTPSPGRPGSTSVAGAQPATPKAREEVGSPIDPPTGGRGAARRDARSSWPYRTTNPRDLTSTPCRPPTSGPGPADRRGRGRRRPRPGRPPEATGPRTRPGRADVGGPSGPGSA